MEQAMLSSRESKKAVLLTPLNTSRLEENNYEKKVNHFY
jgi:hypothetical protein